MYYQTASIILRLFQREAEFHTSLLSTISVSLLPLSFSPTYIVNSLGARYPSALDLLVRTQQIRGVAHEVRLPGSDEPSTTCAVLIVIAPYSFRHLRFCFGSVGQGAVRICKAWYSLNRNLIRGSQGQFTTGRHCWAGVSRRAHRGKRCVLLLRGGGVRQQTAL